MEKETIDKLINKSLPIWLKSLRYISIIGFLGFITSLFFLIWRFEETYKFSITFLMLWLVIGVFYAAIINEIKKDVYRGMQKETPLKSKFQQRLDDYMKKQKDGKGNV